ncbi:MAG: YkgJ family cysteine cluster protein [Methanothrix sp.]|nr:YkgJ family cysteine cluster protein [Methanothrix sp.]
MPETLKDPKKIAIMLLKATALPDEQVFMELAAPKYTTVDYYRMACHMLFECQRCGKCCTSGDPIRLRPEDAAALAKHLKIPLNKAIKKYTIPDPEKPGALDFKHTKPCKFYDVSATGCKLYAARPWSCRIFPFLGIYGSDEQVIVNKSCPGSMKTMEILTAALKEVRAKMEFSAPGLTEVRQNKELLRAVLESV